MLIVNADDWGRSVPETNAALACYKAGRITSVSGMVFMEDSERAAALAIANGVNVGLHLNFTQEFTGKGCPEKVATCHRRTILFLTRNKYSQIICNPFLRGDFACSYQGQATEFERLYGRSPSHIDGHHHMHLSGNLVWSAIIPRGKKVRRNFSFESGEKSFLNRTYRYLVDRWLSRRYQLGDYFFDLTQCIHENKLRRVEALAKSGTVELMTHPIVPMEFDYLIGREFEALLERLSPGHYAVASSLLSSDV
jgi:chitin disaccharide deacetylase